MKLHIAAALCMMSATSFVMSMQYRSDLTLNFLLNEHEYVQSCFGKSDAEVVDFLEFKGKEFRIALKLNTENAEEFCNQYYRARTHRVVKFVYTHEKVNFLAKITAFKFKTDRGLVYNYFVKIKEETK